jgi:hypothetical protein
MRISGIGQRAAHLTFYIVMAPVFPPPLARFTPAGRKPMKRALPVISEEDAKNRTLISGTSGSSLMGGGGPDDLVCGACGALLAQGVGGNLKLQSIVFKCHNCGAFNEAANL